MRQFPFFAKFLPKLERNLSSHFKALSNVWYVKNVLENSDGNMCLPILHLPRVEMHCMLHEKFHRVTGPLKLVK